MKRAVFGVVMAASLVSCGTAPPKASDPLMRGRTQELVLRTDPPGAACSLMQSGKVVASVESTPGTASVPREFGTWPLEPPPPEAIEPMVIVCRKEGFLEYRATVAVVRAMDVWREERPQREISPAEAAGFSGRGSRRDGWSGRRRRDHGGSTAPVGHVCSGGNRAHG